MLKRTSDTLFNGPAVIYSHFTKKIYQTFGYYLLGIWFYLESGIMLEYVLYLNIILWFVWAEM